MDEDGKISVGDVRAHVDHADDLVLPIVCSVAIGPDDIRRVTTAAFIFEDLFAGSVGQCLGEGDWRKPKQTGDDNYHDTCVSHETSA